MYGMATINFYGDESAQSLSLSLKSTTLINNVVTFTYIGQLHKGHYNKLDLSYLFVGIASNMIT